MTQPKPHQQYIVIDRQGRQIGPVVNTPSRAQFFQRAFSSQWPGQTYMVEATR